jgi:TPR repeat protein
MALAAGAMAQPNGAPSPQKKAAFVASVKEKAAAGDATAQLQLASLYEQGFGVRRDYTQVAFWYRKAAEQGNANAQDNLGALYEDGRGVQQSFTEAAFWYRKAAVQGYSSAHTTSPISTQAAKVLRRTIYRLPSGIARQRSRANQTHRFNLVSCMRMDMGYRRTTQKQHFGIARQRSRTMLPGNSASGSCIHKAKVFRRAMRKPISG